MEARHPRLVHPRHRFPRDATCWWTSPGSAQGRKRSPSVWNGGQTQATSGDRGWWEDFTSVKSAGEYYLFDPENNLRSARFRIADDVYRPVLRVAVKMFFYNRSGIEKKPPAADARWADAASCLAAGQDAAARSVLEKDNPATARDVQGGWFDAGDTNKYVTFAAGSVHQLLSAYDERPAIWGDDFGIPESGNGVADLLNEVLWEIAWLKRMQENDGSLLLKVGTLDHADASLPSSDTRARFYVPACSSSTIAGAGMFAHMALTLKELGGREDEVADLRNRAMSAWNWYKTHEKRADCDSQEVKAGDADWSISDQNREAVFAAVYLFELTGSSEFNEFIKQNYTATRPWYDNGWSRYNPSQGDALLQYAHLPGADAAVRKEILQKEITESQTQSDIYGFSANQDLYRAFITDATYHRGTNQVRANQGSTNWDMIQYGLSEDLTGFRRRAEGVIHYFHGVNPMGMVYLSNMKDYESERSVSEIFHTWFNHGTRWDSAISSAVGPAPGYLVGGPDKSFAGSLSWIRNEPVQKCYHDWNTGWPENSWKITEPAIYFQSAYVKLLSKLLPD